MTAIQLLQRDSIDVAAMTLARAFFLDPVFAWTFPNPETRSTALRRLNRVPLEYALRYGRVTAVHGAKAVCVWIPPGRDITVRGMIRSGLLGVPLRTGFGPFAKFIRANDALYGLRKNLAPQPHWYLMAVGVDPDWHRRGVGSALINEGLARADASGYPCYLETFQQRNLAFYERLGFALLQTTTLGGGGLRVWAMRREPQRHDGNGVTVVDACDAPMPISDVGAESWA